MLTKGYHVCASKGLSNKISIILSVVLMPYCCLVPWSNNALCEMSGWLSLLRFVVKERRIENGEKEMVYQGDRHPYLLWFFPCAFLDYRQNGFFLDTNWNHEPNYTPLMTKHNSINQILKSDNHLVWYSFMLCQYKFHLRIMTIQQALNLTIALELSEKV